MSVGSPTCRTWSSSQWRPDNEFETDRLRAAVRKAFHDRALVHRCQWHKRENVVRYLAKSEQAS